MIIQFSNKLHEGNCLVDIKGTRRFKISPYLNLMASLDCIDIGGIECRFEYL